jgi:hypothetical protein
MLDPSTLFLRETRSFIVHMNTLVFAFNPASVHFLLVLCLAIVFLSVFFQTF